MKNTFLLAAAFVFGSLSFHSCDEWEDESYHPGLTSSEALGTWKISQLTLSVPVDIDEDGVANTDIIAETNCYKTQLIKLFENNTGEVTNSTFYNPDEHACVPEEDQNISSWTLIQNSITIVADGGSMTGIIDGNTMTFADLPALAWVDAQGEPIMITGTVVYTKQ